MDSGVVNMVDIIIGERVISKAGEVGVIDSFDNKLIHVAFKTRVAKLQPDAFEKGFLKYENVDLQNKTNESIKQTKLEEERQAEEMRQAEAKRVSEEKAKIKKLMEPIKLNTDINFENISIRLDPAPINLNSVRKNDKDLLQAVFNECDKDTKKLYESFNAKMEYPKYTSHSRSKYCVGFLNKYLNTYVLRVFSRNDVYKKRKTTGVTVVTSDTTEILRVLLINGRIYYFSKNFSYADGFYNNSTSYTKWHPTDMTYGVILNEVIRKCDCEYLNDYIAEKNIYCFLYVDLLLPALYNNKVEIVFKNKLFSAVHRIDDITGYLEEFSSKQIDFASKNNVINTLPIIKSKGLYELDILQKLEPIMAVQRYGNSTYGKLKEWYKRSSLDIADLDKRLIGFLRKLEGFEAALYNDYVSELIRQDGVTVRDLFDKNYIERHDIMMQEKEVFSTQEERNEYAKIAKELSWIDREENGYFIIVPKSISQFKKEGNIQHNCVYTGKYFKRVINRRSVIVFLRKELAIPYVTIEFDYFTFEVLQAYGKYNQRIDSDLYNYIVELGKRLSYEKHLQ